MKTIALLVIGIGLFPAFSKADPPTEGAGGVAVFGFKPVSDDEGWRRMPIEKVSDKPLPRSFVIVSDLSLERTRRQLIRVEVSRFSRCGP